MQNTLILKVTISFLVKWSHKPSQIMVALWPRIWINPLSLRNSWLRFKASGRLPVTSHECIEYTPIKQRKTERCLSTCTRLDLETQGSWPIVPRNVPGHGYQEGKNLDTGWYVIWWFHVCDSEQPKQEEEDNDSKVTMHEDTATTPRRQSARLFEKHAASLLICHRSSTGGGGPQRRKISKIRGSKRKHIWWLYEKSSWHIKVPAGGNGSANDRKKARASSGRSPAEIKGKSETS